ncbi:MOB kinase activator 1A isoform X3 [Manacus candei]|uniref:MOB kinase activator 1A isoform X3 n=1 Tax=Manacus candei TaxID=415023 RepID=UPI0022268C00|nr:MOB kinase activator 1A isoform X3 [Manacus candei]
MSFLFGSRSSKTFKPKKNIPEGSHQYELLKHAEATLGSGNLRQAVMLPEGEDLNEWIAVNTVDFFNQINMLYGTITEFCTESSCPVMSAGPRPCPLPQVRVPLGRRHQHQEAHQVLGAQIHRLPDDVGAGPAGRRDPLSLQDRCPLSQELHVGGQDDPEAALPCLRPHLPPALRLGDPAAGGGPSQHLLQALHLLRAGVQPD